MSVHCSWRVVTCWNSAATANNVSECGVRLTKTHPDAIRPTPEFASSTFDTKYITGLANVDEGMLIMLDIEKLLSGAEMALVDSTYQ